MPQTLEDQYTWPELAEYTADRIDEAELLPKIFHREKFIKWFIAREKIGYLFDWKLIARAYKIYHDLHDEFDHFTVIEGAEGTGKSTLAIQLMAWVSPKASIDDVCYNMHQYLTKLSNIAKDYEQAKLAEEDETILLDEGGIDLFSRESMTASNRMLSKSFFVQRFLNAHVITCIPKFRYLDSTLRDHRVKTLITVKERGKYKCIVGQGIQRVNEMLKKERDLHRIQIPYGLFFDGDFSKRFPVTISQADYTKCKFKNIKSFLKDAVTESEAYSKSMISLQAVGRNIGLSVNTMLNLVKAGKINAHKIGQKYFVTMDDYEKLCTVGSA